MQVAQYVDTNLLNYYITKSGLKIGFICEQLGISRQSFDKKRNGITPFKAAEIYVLCDLMKIEKDRYKIFYPKS